MPNADVAIVDYGMGNLFSVQAACGAAGLNAIVTAEPDEIGQAAAVILPGVGAFAEAMKRLQAQSLDNVLRQYVSGGRPFFSICLGMQLLFSESEEFGQASGLGLLHGRVLRFPTSDHEGAKYKVPAMGWNTVRLQTERGLSDWSEAPLAGVAEGEHFYFVHSYYVEPADPGIVLTTTRYAGVEYVSSLSKGNIFACQFHPERSGRTGLRLYRNLAATIRRSA